MAMVTTTTTTTDVIPLCNPRNKRKEAKKKKNPWPPDLSQKEKDKNNTLEWERQNRQEGRGHVIFLHLSQSKPRLPSALPLHSRLFFCHCCHRLRSVMRDYRCRRRRRLRRRRRRRQVVFPPRAYFLRCD